MKLNNKTNTFIMAIASALLLSACGGGKSTPTKPVEQVTKVVKCSTDNTYTTLEKEDKITALTDNTEISVRHSEDGTKDACVISGDAKVN